jgi:hypothetical protein
MAAELAATRDGGAGRARGATRLPVETDGAARAAAMLAELL